MQFALLLRREVTEERRVVQLAGVATGKRD
jgi:hypothetical protein